MDPCYAVAESWLWSRWKCGWVWRGAGRGVQCARCGSERPGVWPVEAGRYIAGEARVGDEGRALVDEPGAGDNGRMERVTPEAWPCGQMER